MRPTLNIATQICYNRNEADKCEHRWDQQETKHTGILESKNEHCTDDEHNHDAKHVRPGFTDWWVASCEMEN